MEREIRNDEIEQQLRSIDATFDRMMEKIDNISKMIDDLKKAIDGEEGN